MTKITKRWNLEDEFYILTNFKPKNCNLKRKQFEPLSSSPFIARLTVSVPAAGDPLTQWVIVYVYVIYSLFFSFSFFWETMYVIYWYPFARYICFFHFNLPFVSVLCCLSLGGCGMHWGIVINKSYTLTRE